MPKPNKIRELSAGELADANMRAQCDEAWEQEQVARAQAAREKAAALAPSPPGRSVSLSGDGRAMPPPVKSAPYGKPPPPEIQSAPPIKAPPTSKPSPPSPGALGPSPQVFRLQEAIHEAQISVGPSFRNPQLVPSLLPTVVRSD